MVSGPPCMLYGPGGEFPEKRKEEEKEERVEKNTNILFVPDFAARHTTEMIS